MAPSSNKLERIGIGLVLGVALLMFFAPLVSVRQPIAGDSSYNGYNIRNRLVIMQSNLNKVVSSANSLGEDASASLVAASDKLTTPEPAHAPLSLAMAWLIPWQILASSACAALALFALFLSRKATQFLGLAGAVFGALAIFHLSVMSSDLHSWTMELANSGALGSFNNPLLATRMLMVDSFQVNPGGGLLTLTSCMFLATFLSYTGAIPRVSRVLRRHQRVNLSEPIRVRPANSNYPEDNSTTVDVSAGGLYFESAANHYYAGMEVFVTRNLRPDDSNPPEEHGSVVRVQNLPNGKHGVAIQILSKN